MKYIHRIECKDRHLYKIHSRNLHYGIFLADNDSGFLGIRTKFGERYLFVEYHWDNGPPHGTVRPEKEMEECPIEIPEKWGDVDHGELIKWLDKKTKEIIQ